MELFIVSEKNQSIFDEAIRIADMVVKMLGKRCEVAIHDFSNLDKSLIYLAGEVTKRKIGSPATNVVLHELRNKGSKAEDIINYKAIFDNVITMKSSTVFLKDDEGNIIGAFCMNIDVSAIIQLESELQELTTFEEPGEDKQEEGFYTSVNQVVEQMVQNVLDTFNKPLGLLDKEEKIEVVRQLEEKGAFLIKGVVDYVASVLNVSKFTIYNYLKEIRAQEEYKNA